MKTLNSFLSLLFLSIVFLSSCSTSEDPFVETDPQALEQNASEERAIPTSELETGVAISGASKIQGDAPSPSGSLDFQISSRNQTSGYQEAGFNIVFSSTSDDIAGAYIQLLDVEGNKTSSYFDVPSYEFTFGKKAQFGTGKHQARGLFNGKTTFFEEEAINVDFESDLEPGQFCYAICLYDNQGNISQVQQICVEVEAWGGNSQLVGTWEFDPGNYDLSSFEYLLDVECDNGTSTVSANYIKNSDISLVMTLAASGNYDDDQSVNYEFLDYFETASDCSPVYYELDFGTSVQGKWAYNETDNTFSAVIQRLTFNAGGAFDDVEFSMLSDEGDLYINEAKVTVDGNRLKLSIPYYDYFNDQTIYSDLYFNRR